MIVRSTAVQRRNFLVTLGILLGTPLARAQQPARVPVIGLLWNDSVKPSPFVATLVGALNEQGLVAGRDFRIEDRIGVEGYGSMAEGALALARARVDLIVTLGGTATLAAAKVTKVIPIVTIMGTDPVGAGLADSLAHPGRNVTGVLNLAGELIGKRLELLKELVPGLSKVAILIAGGAVGAEASERSAVTAARTLGLQPHVIVLRALEDLDGMIAGVAKARIEGLYVGGSSMLAANASRVVSVVSRHRIPAIYAGERFIDAGGLAVYGPSNSKFFAQIAIYVDRILKGMKPGDLPFQQAETFDLTINMKTARAQGIKIPQAILLRAHRVIE